MKKKSTKTKSNLPILWNISCSGKKNSNNFQTNSNLCRIVLSFMLTTLQTWFLQQTEI